MSSAIPRFKSFEASVLFFNGMYKLPISPTPGMQAETIWQNQHFAHMGLSPREAVLKRMKEFFGAILQNELNEHELIVADLEQNKYDTPIDLLVDLADLLGDIQVYCASEMIRYGIPVNDVLKIIMDSNFSKLDANGNPIYDENGKVCKGPNYWKPEPKIKELLVSLIPTSPAGL